MSASTDLLEIEMGLFAVIEPGQVFEIRVLDFRNGPYAPFNMGGYFDYDHICDAAQEVQNVGGTAKGVYYTPNPCVPALLDRRRYRIDRHGKGESLTGDHEIARRCWLLVDCDPYRPAGIGSTNAQHEAALDLARTIKADLSAEGWPGPFFFDSGNGAHLMYPIGLPTDDGGLVDRCLKALNARFKTGAVHIDTGIHNASRIFRLPGTVNRKGDDTEDRPHRLARLIEIPAERTVVPTTLLDALAATCPEAATTRKNARGTKNRVASTSKNAAAGDVDRAKAWVTDWLTQFKPAGYEVSGGEPWRGTGWRWTFTPCPWNSAHTDASAFIVVLPEGQIAAGCHHNGCRVRTWHDLRELWEPGHEEMAVDPAAKPVVNLPQGSHPISRTGRDLGTLLANSGRYYLRGGTVVTLTARDDELPQLEVVKAATLASDFECVAELRKWGPAATKGGPMQLEPAICSEQMAKMISASAAFRDAVPQIRVLTNCPVLTERGGKLIEITGYDRESGIYAGGAAVPAMELPEARRLLCEMLQGFRFATPADRARAMAALVTPALVFGSLLAGRAALDLSEADLSQAGKGYRNKLTAALYALHITVVTQKRGGVGSLEESFNLALIQGSAFISWDNIRGKVDSQSLESFMTEDTYLARVPYREIVQIDPRRVVVMLTSNKADVTTDLANRSACVRLLKQPEGFAFATYPEGDILDHVRANQPRFLGAVFAVVRAWHAAGKPRTTETRHAIRPWAPTMDWITRNLLDAGPLLDGHRETQARMTNPVLNWLRDVALEVIRTGLAGKWLKAGDLVDLIAESGIETPGLPEQGALSDPATRENAQRATGRKLGLCFRDDELVVLDTITIERQERYESASRYTVREYRFTAAAMEGRPIAAHPATAAAPASGVGGQCPDCTPCDHGAGMARP